MIRSIIKRVNVFIVFTSFGAMKPHLCGKIVEKVREHFLFSACPSHKTWCGVVKHQEYQTVGRQNET